MGPVLQVAPAAQMHFMHFTKFSYHLVMTNSSPWYRWPVEIDGLPVYLLKIVIFHGYVIVYQRVNTFKIASFPLKHAQVKGNVVASRCDKTSL